MLYDRVFITGNRALITLVAVRTITNSKKKTQPRPIMSATGLVLHGVDSCTTKAEAFARAALQWYQHRRENESNPYAQRYNKHYSEHGLMIAGEEAHLTIISAHHGCRSCITLESPQMLLELAGQLVEAAEMIRENERSSQVPMVSEWKQTPGTPLMPVRPGPR